jgi:hypothetical protein
VSKVKRKGKRSKKSAGQRGVDRQRHFDAGGSPTEYRGGPSGYQKNHKDKRNDRKTAKEKAIKDSQE